MTATDVPPFRCVLEAWQAHEAELRHWLLSRLDDAGQADDILQDVFVKALRQGGHFCQLDSPRGWLYQVARHAVIDHHRLTRTTEPAEETLAQPVTTRHPVDALASGLGQSLDALDPDDRDVILRCDIEGETQAAYATPTSSRCRRSSHAFSGRGPDCASTWCNTPWCASTRAARCAATAPSDRATDGELHPFRPSFVLSIAPTRATGCGGVEQSTPATRRVRRRDDTCTSSR